MSSKARLSSLNVGGSQLENNPKEIAMKIKKLYNASIATFVNQIAQNSCKSNNQRFETLKKVPDCVLQAPSFKQGSISKSP